MKRGLRSVLSAFVAMVVVAMVCVAQAIGGGGASAAGHLLVMGGNSNPQGVNMASELNGYISGDPGTHYAGYQYQVVPWSAQTPFSFGSDGTLFDASQAEGVGRIITAVTRTYAPGEKIVVVGYSSSASVVTKYIRALEQARVDGEGPPSPEDLSFVVFGNPNRPNGGLLARFPGLVIPPPLGITFDGPASPSAYQVTDISWQYDGFSDFPSDPRNLLAVINAVVGIVTLHGNYTHADPSNPADILSDSTVGNTRYITLKSTLPLLAPLYAFIPPVFLGGLDAVLRAEIEKGYDRSVSAGVPVSATPLFGPAPTTTPVTTAAKARVAASTSVADATPDSSVPTTSTSTSGSSSSATSDAVAPTTPVESSTTSTTTSTSAPSTGTTTPDSDASSTPTQDAPSAAGAATKTVAAVG